MSDPLSESLVHAIRQIVRVLREDAALRQALAAFGRALAQLEPVIPVTPERDEQPPLSESAVAPAELAPVTPPPPPEPLPPLLLTDNALRVDDRLPPKHSRPPSLPAATPRVAAAISSPAASTRDHTHQLQVWAERFAVKAEGCAWHIKRRQLLQDPRTDFLSTIAPTDRAVIDRARDIEGGCWMWMCQPDSPTPDLVVMERTQHCYENLAMATRLVIRVLQERGRDDDALEPLLQLLAEAQSTLRAALLECGDVEEQDKDQLALHKWLRDMTSEWRIYVPRYMRADDRADPTNWGELSERLRSFEERREQINQHERQRKALLKRIAYHGAKLREGDVEAVRHGQRIADAVRELIDAGVQPSSVELRDVLLPVVDLLPDELELNDAMVRALTEIDRYIATREAEAPPPVAAEDTPEVQLVRSVLSGKAVVLVGGDERRNASRRLQAAFGLARLDWQASRSHQSYFNFESAIRRPDVAVVLLAIRWSSHSFGEISRFCRDVGVPLVRLPGGYGPNQVAAQIIDQAGQQLEIAPAAS